jgi:small subunit ribosomal protein S18
MRRSFNARKDPKAELGEQGERIDYKNIPLLKKFIMESGRIVPSRISGATAKQQRLLTRHIKLARFLGWIPYCDSHRQ